MTGAGDKAFAAGTDISQFRTFDKEADALQYEERIDRVMNAIEGCKVPTIAAIHGACTGGGASIAGVLRPAHRLEEHEVRLPGRAHARQLPLARELQPAGLPRRAFARERHRVPGSVDRGG